MGFLFIFRILEHLNICTIQFLNKIFIHLFKRQGPLNRRYFRKQAGLTNRWQFPSAPCCDLLGIAQADKAVRVGLNETLIRIMSGRVISGGEI